MFQNRLTAWLGLAAFCFTMTTLAGADDGFDLRNVKWGMNKEEVVKSEDKKPEFEKEDFVGYDETIDRKPVKLGYYFIDNKLCRAVYLLTSNHTNKNDYITDYDDFKNLLTEKYGKPKEDKTVWKHNLYKNDPQNWGLAVTMGSLVKITKWETKDTNIVVFMDGENFECRVVIQYESKVLNPLDDKVKKNKEKSKL